MTYTRVVQYGDITEVYTYQKPLSPPKRRKPLSKIQKKRSRDRMLKYGPSQFSRRRSKIAFFRLVYENIYKHPSLPDFLTLTSFKDISFDTANKAHRLFFQRLRIKYAKDVKYISVPELQKNGTIHYHCLVWGIPKELSQKERNKRILQRQWQRGYLDVRSATYKSAGLAGYLTKYFSKTQNEKRLYGRRLYNASRNIYRPREAGSNSLSHYLEELVDKETLHSVDNYATVWLGRCKKEVYKSNNS